MLVAATLLLLTGASRSVVLQGSVSLKRNDPPASVAIIMTEGRAEATGFAGGNVYSGRFVVAVHAPGVRMETDLNDLLGVETLSFAEHSYWPTWPIVFQDLNHDGQPDFSIAQHSCANNAEYSLLTIGADGRVSKLDIIPNGRVWITGGEPSSAAIRLTAHGYRVGTYDNSMGSGVVKSYRWDEERHAFVLSTPTSGHKK